MGSDLKDILTTGNQETLRALLYACAATEAENMDHWLEMCPRPETCPLATVVKADARQRDSMVDSFTDQQVLQHLTTYFNCYENLELKKIRN